jgi:hypothetical protein
VRNGTDEEGGVSEQLDLLAAASGAPTAPKHKCDLCKQSFAFEVTPDAGPACRGGCNRIVCDPCSYGESLAWCRPCLVARVKKNRYDRWTRRYMRRRNPYAYWLAKQAQHAEVIRRRGDAGRVAVGMMVCYTRSYVEQALGMDAGAGFARATDSIDARQADALWRRRGIVTALGDGPFAGSHCWVRWGEDFQPTLVGLRSIAWVGSIAACESERPVPELEPAPKSRKQRRREKRQARMAVAA